MTLKTTVLLLAAASASAFAPVSTTKSTNVVAKAFAGGMVGGEGPEPMPFTSTKTSKNFDPAGFAEVRHVDFRSCYSDLVKLAANLL